MAGQWKGGAENVINIAQGSSSVSVEYHDQFGAHDDLLLLEVDDKILPDIINNRVTIRGQPDEDAVFCTPSTTYGMKFVGNSNSVFLIPAGEPSPMRMDSSCTDISRDAKTVASVIKVAGGAMELSQVAPRLDKLKALLKERPYRLEEEDTEMEMENEPVCPRGLYMFEDLTNMIQASDEELVAGLHTLSAININGFWRIVEEKDMDDILTMILRNSVLHEWLLGALKEREVLSVLEGDGFPRAIVLHCLTIYGSKTELPEGDFCWSLDEKKVCLQLAKLALVRKKMKLESFMEIWASSLPSGMHANLELLDGEVLYERMGIETWIRAFSVSELPSTPAERFAALFQVRSKWEGKDLRPYIRDLRVPGLSSEALLLKYARRTQTTGDAEPIYSAR